MNSSVSFSNGPVAEVPASDVLALAAGKRRAVDAEDHLQRRLVHGHARHGSPGFDVADSVADFDLVQTHHRYDVARFGLFDFLPTQFVKRVNRDHLRRLLPIVRLHQGHLLATRNRAREDPANRDPPDVVRPVERGDQHLQRRVRVDFGPGDPFEHHVEQGLH